MKVLILFLFSISVMGNDYPLKTKMNIYRLHSEVYYDIFENTAYSSNQLLHSHINELESKKKEQVIIFLKAFSKRLPNKYLRPLVYYRFIQPDQQKLKKLLVYTMFAKLMVLRDATYLPGQLGQKALKGLRLLTEHKSIEGHNAEVLMLPLYREKAALLAALEDDHLFYDAMNSTSLFDFKLSAYVPRDGLFSVGPIGPIPGNKTTLDKNFSLTTAIKSAKHSVIINPDFLEKDKNWRQNLQWLANHPNKNFKAIIIFNENDRSHKVLEAAKELQITTLVLRRSTYQRSVFHPYIQRMSFALIDGHQQGGRFIHQDQLTQSFSGPLAAIFQAVLLNETREPNIIEIPEKIAYTGNHLIDFAHSTALGKSNMRETLIRKIIHAQESLRIDQRYLYDPMIVDTLIKKKIKNPKIDIKILLDMSLSYDMNGLPNTMYLKELQHHKIEIRARDRNELNVVIIDEEEVILGNPNLTPDAMDGHHHESFFVLKAPKLAKQYYSQFQETWEDPKKVYKLNLQNFKIRVGKKYLKAPLSQVVNDMGAKLLKNRHHIIR